ncbi:Gfo/Idh/MocA family oxidoreductase [Chloroflexi bacterium TSY]|nr:Gfo/Idh/MocA family oxidoreductase [Chloroflexi bacterium TSY]
MHKKKKLTCGLIGLSQGWYANVYASELLAMKDVEFVGICDLGKSWDYALDCIGMSAEEFAAKFGTTLYHDAAEMLQQKLDMVVVASEIAEHYETTRLALEAGTHVFACKPFTFISDEVRRAIQIAQKRERMVLVGLPSRYEDGLSRSKFQV